MLKNNIKRLLEERQLSINKFSQLLNKDYKSTFELVNRTDLSDTKVGTLNQAAKILSVEIPELFADDGCFAGYKKK